MTSIKMFHGTTEENAEQIMKDGFGPGTYFSYHLEEAISMGGDYVFEVLFDERPTEYWEYISSDLIGVDRIISLVSYSPIVKYESEEAQIEFRKMGFMKEIWDADVEICSGCKGRGQMENHPMYTRWRDGRPVTVCDECDGRGAKVVRGDQDILMHQIYK